MLGVAPARCVAVEDSPSGAGAGVNAGFGLVVGYVGATHITDKDAHAAKLMSGANSISGKGCDVVVLEYQNLLTLLLFFREKLADGTWEEERLRWQAGRLDRTLLASTTGKLWAGGVRFCDGRMEKGWAVARTMLRAVSAFVELEVGGGTDNEGEDRHGSADEPKARDGADDALNGGRCVCM